MRAYSIQKKRCEVSSLIQKIKFHPKNNVMPSTCKDLDAVYIGETKRKFKTTGSRAVKNGDVNKNEIADHSWSDNHNFNWK